MARGSSEVSSGAAFADGHCLREESRYRSARAALAIRAAYLRARAESFAGLESYRITCAESGYVSLPSGESCTYGIAYTV